MNVDVKIIIAAILLCIVVAGIVLFTPVQPNRIEAIAESASAIITAASIIILVGHNREAAKQHKESTIRSEWYILQAERQRIETDMNKFHPAPQSVYTKLVDRHREISEQMHKLREQYRDVLSDWPPPPQTFKTLIEAESDSPK